MSVREDATRIGESEAGGARAVRFGAFQVDFQERDLYKRGLRLKLQQKPFHLLELLLERAGELVTRKEITDRLWPGLYLNFERSLNTAVNALRQALGDSPRNPRFIETRQGLGYRFIAPVERVSMPTRAGVQSRRARETSEAHQDYLKGRHFYNKISEDALQRSIGFFESALAADPRCAPALAGLADAYILLMYFHAMPADKALEYARERAAAALRIDDRLAEAHASLGSVLRFQRWDWPAAETHFLKAIELNPDSAASYRCYADHLCSRGFAQDAVNAMQRALELDPLSLRINASMAWTLYMNRDFEGALAQSWKALAIEQDCAAVQHTLGLAYEQLGDFDEAITELRNAHACSGGHPIAVAAMGHVYATGGDAAKARKLLDELHATSRQRSVSPYWIGLIHTALGDSDAAIRELARGLKERDPWSVWLGVEPRFDPLRSDARFSRFIHELRLAPDGAPSQSARGA
jgi:DNA-binding winged helix-turn-helix (wHTH) protein/Flp pilus assembly protein TadD